MKPHTTSEIRYTHRNFADEASVSALIGIACNKSNSASLRELACDHLEEWTLEKPDLAAHAAQELFRKRDAGAPPEIVFDVLVRIIRNDRTETSIFKDSVDAVCENEENTRRTAALRVIEALQRAERSEAAA